MQSYRVLSYFELNHRDYFVGNGLYLTPQQAIFLRLNSKIIADDNVVITHPYVDPYPDSGDGDGSGGDNGDGSNDHTCPPTPIISVAEFHHVGELKVIAATTHFSPVNSGAIYQISTYVNTPSAGSNIIARVKINGVVVQTITVISNTRKNVISDINIAITPADQVTIDIDEVGSGNAGENLSIKFFIKSNQN